MGTPSTSSSQVVGSGALLLCLLPASQTLCLAWAAPPGATFKGYPLLINKPARLPHVQSLCRCLSWPGTAVGPPPSCCPSPRVCPPPLPPVVSSPQSPAWGWPSHQRATLRGPRSARGSGACVLRLRPFLRDSGGCGCAAGCGRHIRRELAPPPPGSTSCRKSRYQSLGPGGATGAASSVRASLSACAALSTCSARRRSGCEKPCSTAAHRYAPESPRRRPRSSSPRVVRSARSSAGTCGPGEREGGQQGREHSSQAPAWDRRGKGQWWPSGSGKGARAAALWKVGCKRADGLRTGQGSPECEGRVRSLKRRGEGGDSLGWARARAASLCVRVAEGQFRRPS